MWSRLPPIGFPVKLSKELPEPSGRSCLMLTVMTGLADGGPGARARSPAVNRWGEISPVGCPSSGL